MAAAKPSPRPASTSGGSTFQHFILVLSVGLGMTLAVDVGASVADTLQATAPWQFIAAYGAPMGLVSLLLWAAWRLGAPKD